MANTEPVKRRKKQACINLPSETLTWLRKQAEEEERSLSWVLERIVKDEQRRIANKLRRAAA